MKRLLLSGLLAVTVQAVDVSGTYENIGTVVRAEPARAGDAVSFRGLVGLEFDLPLARARFWPAQRFTIRQMDSQLRIRCLDGDGNEIWIAKWDRDAGYGIEGDQVKFVFSKYQDVDSHLFVLRPAGDGQMLVVEVFRIQTTCFGPVGNPLGTFLFSRVPGKSHAGD